MDLESCLIGSTKLIDLEKSIQKKFIAKVYTLLSFQLLITMLMSLSCYFSLSATQFIIKNLNFLYFSIFTTFISLILIFCYDKIYPINYILLLIFTLGESYSITYICLSYDLPSIILAWGLSLSIFIILSIYVLTTKKDFNYIGSGLFASLWIIILAGIIQIIWLPNDMLFKTIIASIGAIIAVGYILYDTSELLHRLTPDDYICGTVSLYLDILLLFLKLLEIFGKKRD